MPTLTLTASAAAWHRYPRLAVHTPLHVQARRFAILTASESVSADANVARYMLTDCHSDGAHAYCQPRYSLVPAFEPWQAAILDAMAHLRRWRYYSDLAD